MKKLSVILAMLFTLSLTSCGPKKLNVKLSKDPSEIQSIDIYSLDKWYDEGDVKNLRDENSPVYTLASDQYADFADEIASLEFEEEGGFIFMATDGGYNYGNYVVSIVYIDGSYDIIASSGQFYYSPGKDGKGRYNYDHADYCGETQWSDIIKGYIEVE